MQNEKLAQWVTTQTESPDITAVRCRLSGHLPPAFDIAMLRVVASDLYRVWLNGKPVGISEDWQGTNWRVTGMAKPGLNTIDIEVQARKTNAANCWLYLDKALPEPTSLTQLEFSIRDMRFYEWVYVQFIDVSGRLSGYICPEVGRADLMFDASGAQRTLRFNPRTETQFSPNKDFDWTKVSKLRLRIDQKDVPAHPKGAFSLSSVRVNGELLNPSDWTVTPGQGSVASELHLSEGELQCSYHFNSLPECSLLCELAVADKQGVKLAQIISDEKTAADHGTPRLAKSTLFPNWMTYLPARVNDMLDEGTAPCRTHLSLSTSARKELYEQNEEIGLSVAIHSFDKPDDTQVQLELEQWNGVRMTVPSVRCLPYDKGQSCAQLTLPKLAEGLYRVTARSRSNTATAAFAVLPKGQTSISSLLPKLKPYTQRKQLLGATDYAYMVHQPAFLWSCREMGLNLWVAHITPLETQTGVTDDLCAFCKATGTHFTFNVEMPNYTPVSNSTNGKNSFDAADGCFRWDVDADTLRKAAATGVFEGVTYDESEHMQLSRNGYSQLPEPNRKPFYVETTGLSLHDAYAVFKKAVSRLVKRNSQYGAKMLVESVFPALWAPMAECGMTLVPKLLKEDVHPVVLAEALGAAIQHNAKLWFSPDLWYYGDLPGHSARYMQMAMRCCHLAGVDTCYVESATKMYSLNGSSYTLTRHGRVLKEHYTHWIPAHPRNYSYRDYQPEVAIVRFPDSDWGQASCNYWDYLYGAMNLHSNPQTRDHLQVWSLLTDSVLNGRAVNFNGEPVSPPHAYQIWRFSIPSAPVVVYDHNVGYKHLKDVKVIFACGAELSEQTVDALQNCVKAGAVCFISKHLAPVCIQPVGSVLSARIPEGKGAWVVMSEFTHEAMTPYKQLLPKNDGSMWLRFKNKRVKVG